MRLPPRRIVHDQKSLLCEPVKLDCDTFTPACLWIPCSAICGSVRRNIAFGADNQEQGETLTARFASTTLVLESYAADFSTEAGNSALIANNEILAQPASAAK